MSKISTVNLNDPAEGLVSNPDVPDPQPVAITETVPTEAPEHAAADDIDTDELEALLIDLKKTKKQNKAPPKPRTRKPKTTPAVVVEEAPVVAEPVAVEPVITEPVLETPKPKRKYARKANKIPDQVPEPMEPATPRHVEEPPKRSPGSMIEEMQRAERALRYQMRKNKMQTLVSQAF